MEPTPKALELAEPVRAILDRMRTLRSDHMAFDPKTSERTFKFFMVDAAVVQMLPPLLSYLATEAPKVHVQAVRCDVQYLDQWLESGLVHFATGSFPTLVHGIRRHPLWTETYAAVVRKNHPRIGARPDAQAFLAEKHALVSLRAPATTTSRPSASSRPPCRPRTSSAMCPPSAPPRTSPSAPTWWRRCRARWRSRWHTTSISSSSRCRSSCPRWRSPSTGTSAFIAIPPMCGSAAPCASCSSGRLRLLRINPIRHLSSWHHAAARRIRRCMRCGYRDYSPAGPGLAAARRLAFKRES